jgi:hypothetical protein
MLRSKVLLPSIVLTMALAVMPAHLLAQGSASQLSAQVAVFDETESILALAPVRQVEWARAYASGPGRRASAEQIQAAIRSAFPNDPLGMRAQTALIVQVILMGDIVGALRSYTAQDRTNRRVSQELVREMERVASARSSVIRNFARTKPPRAYAGGDPSQVARAQDRSSRYTQYVQMSTQLMNELQNTERELVDRLQTMDRDMQTFWQSYAGFRDEEFRTNERAITTR